MRRFDNRNFYNKKRNNDKYQKYEVKKQTSTFDFFSELTNIKDENLNWYEYCKK